MKNQGLQHERCTEDTEQGDGYHDTMRVRMDKFGGSDDDGEADGGGQVG